MEAKPLVFCIGANHNTAGLDVREELFLSEDELRASLKTICARHRLSEALVISTCNRFELYGVLPGEAGDDALRSILFDLEASKADTRPDMREKITHHCYIHRQSAAMEHMFAVASGLDSLVLGETQITGQFKDAMQFSLDLGIMDSVFQRLCQDALRVAKEVRTHTEISKKTVSISHAAIDLANQVFGNISSHSVLIIGAGEMASVASKYAIKYGPKELFIVNRTVQRAEDVVRELGAGKAVPLDQLSQTLPKADIVIASTSSEVFILDRTIIEKVQVARSHRPLLLVDIALPRNIDPKIAQLEDIYLFDVDDLKQVVAEHVKSRSLAAEKARGMIVERALGSQKWLDGMALKPALAQFKSYLDDLVRREMERTLGKGLKELTSEQAASLKGLVESIAAKIAGDAGARVRTPPDGYFSSDLAAALTVLFPNPDKDRP